MGQATRSYSSDFISTVAGRRMAGGTTPQGKTLHQKAANKQELRLRIADVPHGAPPEFIKPQLSWTKNKSQTWVPGSQKESLPQSFVQIWYEVMLSGARPHTKNKFASGASRLISAQVTNIFH
ncbi:hypothetical protein E2C01_071160 [Portunus trituberculatus]|uniref:Uncharacterized protein n=1 Tax=Portunus trituberculatus TaxID=210409 RepID=A0A5B7HZ99_PORTR|nr:hypothetical protein [Portunus trituberculatus]